MKYVFINEIYFHVLEYDTALGIAVRSTPFEYSSPRLKFLFFKSQGMQGL